MKNLFIHSIRGIIAALLAIGLLFYFSPTNHQNAILLCLVFTILLASQVFKINYKRLLQISAIAITIAILCKSLSMTVLASQVLVLAYVIFVISFMMMLAEKLLSLYTKQILNLVRKL